MSGKHQGLRYFQKFLNSKASERNALAKKVLRCVLAVGFVLSPWLGGEAYAGTAEAPGIVRVPGTGLTDTKFLDGTSNVAHIYAEQADITNKVGFNRFQTFNVAAGETANLHFQKEAGGTILNSLVNSVESQISISGTVNAIRNDKIGGNLFFVSPNGMVVGSTGVINAGALTAVVPASLDYLKTLQQAVNGIQPEGSSIAGWGPLAENRSIVINGKINTATGINLEAQTIQIAKVSGSTPTPSLLTGVVFEQIVNTDTYRALPIANNRLIAYRDENNKIIVADPSNLEKATGDDLLQGDGRIRVYARKDIAGEGLHGTATFTEGVVNAIGDVAIESGRTIEIDKPTSGNTTSSTVNKTSITSGNQIKLVAEIGDIYNAGTIIGAGTIDFNAGYNGGSDDASITNNGTIQSTGGGMSFAADRLLTNNGTIKAKDQIAFTVGGTLTNQGKIESTRSNVQAHIGRNFQNLAVYDNSSGSSILTGGIIEAGGNVQVDYNLDTENTGIGVATEAGTIDGIYNSGLIWAVGENGKDPVYDDKGNIVNSGSGNIWLTSAYNITNDGTMIANRQITLNARDFLHNYGLIEGVTYLDIKSIMGYVYNHKDATIKATGGNIDLSSGQANLVIEGDKTGQLKELYRKFTPIIIEGSVEATSALNNTTSETNQGNINIRAYLGDIYINGGTIEAKAGTSGEVESVAGDVILDAAQNITIGFQTKSAKADDPTTQAGPNGENKDKYERDDEREYYKPKVDDTSGKLVSGTAVNITGTNITLTSGSNANTISMSAVNNLTASDTITINTASMNIAAGTFNAGTLKATGALELSGGSITSTGALTISGAKGLTIGNGAGISTGGNLTFASSEGAVINNHTWDNQNGSVTLSGKTGVTNNATITSSNGIGMTSADGTIVNNAALTAKGGAVSFEGKGNITNNALIEANGSVYIISTGGKVTNRAGIIAGKNFATTSAASPFSLRARVRAVDNGSVVISGSSGVINDANGSIQANDSVLLESSAGDISNSSSITATNGSVTISGNGSVNNSADITASGGSVEISGNGGIENTANIEASKDVSMTASAGSITNSGTTEVKATGGSVTISGSGDITGGTVTAGNGSVSMSGGGNITGGTVTADNGSVSMSGGGNVTGGTVTGNDVILAGGSGSNVTAASITVDNSLQLQGDNITATNVERGNDASGALNVGVSGAGGSNSTAQGDVNIKITSNVVFSNVNVSNANVETTGTMEVDKLHVEGKAGFVSSDTTVNVYGQGVTPDPNDTTAIQDKGDGNSGWLTLKIDDTGVQSTFVGEENKTDYPVQMSGKLVDYDPYDTYMEHYGDVADIFGRTDLIVADLIVANASPNGGTTQDGVVVLKQDDDGLRIEEEKKE